MRAGIAHERDPSPLSAARRDSMALGAGGTVGSGSLTGPRVGGVRDALVELGGAEPLGEKVGGHGGVGDLDDGALPLAHAPLQR